MKTAYDFVVSLELYGHLDKTTEVLIAFAKMHVKEALKAASEVPLKSEPCWAGGGYIPSCDCPDYIVDSDSILNCYPESLIK